MDAGATRRLRGVLRCVLAANISGQFLAATRRRRHSGVQAALPELSGEALRRGDLIFVSKPLRREHRFESAIRQTGLKTIEWWRAQGVQVLDECTSEHVAMVVVDGSSADGVAGAGAGDAAARSAVAVVESAPAANGVRVLPLQMFLEEHCSPGAVLYHGRLRGLRREEARRAVDFAVAKVGAGYAHDFAAPCDDGGDGHGAQAEEYYCSSLIDYAYRESLRRGLVFTSTPFPLLFEPEAYWERYYRKLGKPLPCGFGSNPTLLMHSPLVELSVLHLSGSGGENKGTEGREVKETEE